MEKKLKYKNITVSGLVCTGSTTLATSLAQKLGWEHRNSSQVLRDYMKKRGLPLEQTTKSPDKLHLETDNYVKEKLKTGGNQVFEGMLAGFMAQGIQGVLKVLVICPDDAVRIDRLVNRDNITVEEVKEHIKKREEENLAKFQKLYGKHDFWDPKYYDLVIDTYSHSKEETLEEVLKKLGFYEQQK